MARQNPSLLPVIADDTARRRIANSWAFRARAEVESAARFARLAGELHQTNATPVVVDGMRKAAGDERRHARLCARLADTYGIPNADRHDPPRVRAGRADLELRDRLLWEVVSACCIGETMNMSLLTVMLDVAGDETTRTTVVELARDEVDHARLGWAHPSAERAAGRGSFIAEALPSMLEASVERDFFRRSPEQADLSYFGEFSQDEHVTIFEHTLNEVIFLGLEALGVDSAPSRAWLATKLSDR